VQYFKYRGHFGISDFPWIAAGSQDPDFFYLRLQSSHAAGRQFRFTPLIKLTASGKVGKNYTA